jgi:hypothetical protein
MHEGLEDACCMLRGVSAHMHALMQVVDTASKYNLRLVIALVNNWAQDSMADNKCAALTPPPLVAPGTSVCATSTSLLGDWPQEGARDLSPRRRRARSALPSLHAYAVACAPDSCHWAGSGAGQPQDVSNSSCSCCRTRRMAAARAVARARAPGGALTL